MALTLTSTHVASPAVELKWHNGVNVIAGEMTAAGNSLSASADSTTFLLEYIPHGAKLTGGFFYISSAATVGGSLSVGGTVVVADGDITAGVNYIVAGGICPLTVSVTDNAVPMAALAKVTITPGTTTSSAVVKWAFEYAFDNPS
jgi:hypothetical protein